MTIMAAILVIVLVSSAGNPPYRHFYYFANMDACERAIKTALVLPPGHDDRRGVQAMFCVESRAGVMP